MGERRRVTAAACCMLCLLCHQSARCLAQLASEASDNGHQPLADGTTERPGNSKVIALLLRQYGDGKAISPTGFETLLTDLKLAVPSKLGDRQMLVASNNGNTSQGSNNKTALAAQKEACEAITAARRLSISISAEQVLDVCPALLVQLMDPSHCLESHDHTRTVQHPLDIESNNKLVWVCATVSIVVISACGLLAVAVIPIMQKMFYQQLLQFLVSLAVGSLCGDALLHLLPHAMSGGHEKGHHHDESDVDLNLWRGFVALLGIVLFFFTEKCLTHIGEWKRRNQRKKKQAPANVRVMRDTELQGNSSVGEKLCKHKYSSYPYCYAEITGAGAEEGEKKCIDPAAEPPSEPIAGSSPVVPEAFPKEGKEEEAEIQVGEGYTVIVREHERTHHGHSHSHGHVHSAPHSLSAVAWMVVMGDGLHNLTDGLAIGAAFAASLPGGFSTALAVFCHELPHELGDFAVLLKAGMSAKQAVCYNLLSSVLCFFGMVLGVCLGHSEETAQWVFAAAAGMFLYIALVDMIPELTSGHSEGTGGTSSCFQTLLLQLSGMTTGLTIMFFIALYEEALHSIFCKVSDHMPCSSH